jgi:two-component system chemotaxis response regulator CheV
MVNNEIDKKTNLAQNNQLELLCFRLIPDGVIFAVNVFKVRETVKFSNLTELPDVSTAIDGLLTLRNSIIPIIDLRKWLYNDRVPKGLAEKDNALHNKDRQIIICEFNEVIIGVKIYKADHILRRNWEDIMVPITNEYGNKVNNYTKNNNGDIVYIVDVEQMLSDIFPGIEHEILNEIEHVESFDFDHSKWVLVAEDSNVATKALKRVLGRIGVRHKTFLNGQLLLDYIGDMENVNDIGLIITDLEMPVTSGFTVIKTLKANSKTSHIPIVVNSSMSGNSNVEMASKLNAEGFMAKTKPEKIAEFVKQYLGK